MNTFFWPWCPLHDTPYVATLALDTHLEALHADS